jgi:hypothetical protein
MAARIVAAVEERLVVVLATAEAPSTSNHGVGEFDRHAASFAGRRR